MHGRADLLDDSDRLVAQHQRRLAPDIPGHDIAGADAACGRAHEHLGWADRRTHAILDADVAKIVEPSNLHIYQ